MGVQYSNGDRRRPIAEPQILPPLDPAEPSRPYSYTYAEPLPPPPPPARRNVRSWAVAPGTYLLVGINLAVFVLMVLNGVPAVTPTTDQLMRWGANHGVSVLFQGEWWRLLTAMFVHVGIIHLATNMWCLWNLGLLGEPLLGPFGILAVYLLSGAAGNLLSVAINPQIVGAGASGAVFGLAGILIVLLKRAKLPVPEAELRSLRKSVIYFAVLNFAIGLSTYAFQTSIQIDNMAHLGGFLCGLALGVPLAPSVRRGRERYLRRQMLTFGSMAVLLAAFGYGLASFWSE